jgi:low temperature requirement protein LtrA
MALHTYAMLHFLLIAGIIFSALAIKKTVGHPDEHLKEIPAVALGLGIALYAGGLAAIRKRDIGKWNWFRLVVAALSLALIPVFKEITALGSISIVTAILLVLIAVEATYYRDVRARVRSTA